MLYKVNFIIIIKETNNTKALKRQYGYICNKVVSEYNELIERQTRRFKDHFSLLAKRNTVLLADVFNLVKLISINI